MIGKIPGMGQVTGGGTDGSCRANAFSCRGIRPRPRRDRASTHLVFLLRIYSK
jgi:hypothetical protein